MTPQIEPPKPTPSTSPAATGRADLDKLVKIFERLDSQVSHRQNLINHRITWLVTSQSFLFSGFAISADFSTLRDIRLFLLYMIPTLGLITSLLTSQAIHAAEWTFNYLRDRRHELVERNPELQELVGQDQAFLTLDRRAVKFGLLPPVILPWLFSAAWVAALVRVYLAVGYPHQSG